MKILINKGGVRPFIGAVKEYFPLGHAEQGPTKDLLILPAEVFYLPMHGVVKPDRTTTKLRIVFDASAKSRSGASLNDRLLIGPTVYPPISDIILKFRTNKIAITEDISNMFRTVVLHEKERDLHRFVFRCTPNERLKFYRMTKLTFGVTASPF